MQNNYKGFSLFSDIADAALRTRNRAVVLANIAEDNMENKRINMKGAGLIIGYFNTLPMHERNGVKDAFSENMQARGFALVNS